MFTIFPSFFLCLYSVEILCFLWFVCVHLSRLHQTDVQLRWNDPKRRSRPPGITRRTRSESHPWPSGCVFVESPGWKAHSFEIPFNIYWSASRSAARLLFVSGESRGVWEECFVFLVFVFIVSLCVFLQAPFPRPWRSPAPSTNRNEPSCYSVRALHNFITRNISLTWSEHISLIPQFSYGGVVT